MNNNFYSLPKCYIVKPHHCNDRQHLIHSLNEFLFTLNLFGDDRLPVIKLWSMDMHVLRLAGVIEPLSDLTNREHFFESYH